MFGDSWKWKRWFKWILYKNKKFFELFQFTLFEKYISFTITLIAAIQFRIFIWISFYWMTFLFMFKGVFKSRSVKLFNIQNIITHFGKLMTDKLQQFHFKILKYFIFKIEIFSENVIIIFLCILKSWNLTKKN